MTEDKNSSPPPKIDLRSLPPVPNKSFYNPDPDYIRALIEATGLSQRAVAEQIGVSERMIRYYVTRHRDDTKGQKVTYVAQYAIERLAAASIDGTDNASNITASLLNK